jgi:hypothetical protein
MKARDYRLLADALKQAKGTIARDTPGWAMREQGFDTAVYAITDAITDSEPAFDRVRFLQASGYDVIEQEC